MNGKHNVALGLIFMSGFMLYGFVLTYLRDFAPDKAQWIADYAVGMPLAAGVLYSFGILLSPAMGAVLMSVSTIVVALYARFLKVGASH